jgi:hypothetical protein
MSDFKVYEPRCLKKYGHFLYGPTGFIGPEGVGKIEKWILLTKASDSPRQGSSNQANSNPHTKNEVLKVNIDEMGGPFCI